MLSHQFCTFSENVGVTPHDEETGSLDLCNGIDANRITFCSNIIHTYL